MDDHQAWQEALDLAGRLYGRMPDVDRERVDLLVMRIMELKQELLDLTLCVGSASVCRTCGGSCCLHGKYYVTLLDLLAYRVIGVSTPVPNFGVNSACPYGGAQGCRLAPGLRPMTCVIFNCDLIEELMSAELRQRAASCEQELRTAIAGVERLAGIRFGRPALLAAEEQ